MLDIGYVASYTLFADLTILLVQVCWHDVNGWVCGNSLSFLESEACANILEDLH